MMFSKAGLRRPLRVIADLRGAAQPALNTWAEKALAMQIPAFDVDIWVNRGLPPGARHHSVEYLLGLLRPHHRRTESEPAMRRFALSPSRRAARADMRRASFFAVIGGWAGAVILLLAVILWLRG
jgi:hypothetical protein